MGNLPRIAELISRSQSAGGQTALASAASWAQGLELPAGRQPGSAASGEGVWVLGLIRGSAADAAGVQQGDQLLAVDGRPLQGQSPFEVASLLQGQPELEQQDEEPLSAAGLGLVPSAAQPVELKVRCCWLGCIALYCSCELQPGLCALVCLHPQLILGHVCQPICAGAQV